MDYDEEDLLPDGSEDVEGQVEELTGRIERLEAKLGEDYKNGIGLFYALGMAIAVVLSWARNASILWCITHGLLSWGYVIYFALTRK